MGEREVKRRKQKGKEKGALRGTYRGLMKTKVVGMLASRVGRDKKQGENVEKRKREELQGEEEGMDVMVSEGKGVRSISLRGCEEEGKPKEREISGQRLRKLLWMLC